VGYKSPSIIKYLEPLTGDLFTARHADCIFDEDNFPALGGDNMYHNECQEINWNASGIQSFDPRTIETEREVQKIINLQNIANNLPEAFTDYKGVIKSHNPAVNVPERVEVPTQNLPNQNKRGRNTVTKDKPPRKLRKPTSKTVNANQHHADRHQLDIVNPNNMDIQQIYHIPSINARTNTSARTSEDPDSNSLGNIEESQRVNEISTNYIDSGESFNRKTTIVDINFASKIASNLQLDPEPKTMAECIKRSDWIKWKEAIEAELHSLKKREVFSSVIPTPRNIFPVGSKWVFVRKRNENNEVVRYKAKLVAQGFTQRPGIDYDETYSPVMSGITFQYLISLAAQKGLSMHLMDVVTAYFYGSLDSDIYMKVPERLDIPNKNQSRNMYCVKLQKSLYGLKQSGRMWYNRLKEFLLQKGFSNNDDCPCVFIKKSLSGFCIISVYVDDLNIIGST